MSYQFFRQLRLAIWKNFLIKKRGVFGALLELTLPLLLFLILVYVREKRPLNYVEKTEFEPHTLNFNESLPKEYMQEFRLFQLGVESGLLNFDRYIAYTPSDNEDVDAIVELVRENLSEQGIRINFIRPFETESEVLQSAKENENMLAAITFDKIPSNSSLDKEFSYKIRMRSSIVTNTKYKWPFKRNTAGPRSTSYFKNGFVLMQNVVDRAIIQHKTNQRVDIQVEVNQFPFPAHYADRYNRVLQYTLPFIMVSSWLYSFAIFVNNIVGEKEKRIKEAMKIMGLWNGAYYMSWFITFFLFMTIDNLIICILAKKFDVFAFSSFSVVFVWFECYSFSVISLGFLVSVFFDRAHIAASCSGMIYFAVYLPYAYISYHFQDLNPLVITLSSFLSPTNFGLGCKALSEWELIGEGLNWNNFHQPTTAINGFSFSRSMIMLIVDGVVYCVLAWYISQVFPGQYGIARAYYFPIENMVNFFKKKKDYFFGNRHSTGDDIGFDYQQLNTAAFTEQNIELDNLGEEDEQAKIGISIKNLSKTYDNKNFAVKDLSLDMYQDQVTCLLGHNGAGKTTTLSILIGLFSPSSGSVIIGKNKISENRHSNIGYCPQYNVLFDSLTIEEHLYFFYCLKCDVSSIPPGEVKKILGETSLHNKQNVFPGALSGGMKRTLSVAIALVGNSKYIILDEPTAGMDPCARRATWDLLIQHKADRTFVLTTHHMDEADVLGDRIAIMSAGELRAMGTPMFLKNKYGKGYYLYLVKNDNFSLEEVEPIIKEYVPDAELARDVGNEVMFVLPTEHRPVFAQLFHRLDKDQELFKISSYGISVPTLEDVFHEIAHLDEAEEKQDVIDFGSQEDGLFSNSFVRGRDTQRRRSSNSSQRQDQEELLRASHPQNDFVKSDLRTLDNGNRYSGIRLSFQQLGSLLYKRFCWSKRDWIALILQLLIPALFVLLAMTVATAEGPVTQLPELKLDTSWFPSPNFIPYSFVPGYPSPDELDSLLSSVTEANDIFEDRNSANISMSTILLNNRFQRWHNQFGAFSSRYSNSNRSLPYENSSSIPKLNHTDHNVTLKSILTIWLNFDAYHSPPIFLNKLNNVLFKFYSKDTENSIKCSNFPLPMSERERKEALRFFGVEFLEAIMFVIALSFVPASFTIYIVRERESKCKQLQLMSGVHFITLWLGSILWDFLSYLVPVAIILLIILGFGQSAFTGGNLVGVVSLFLAYGWAQIPLMYVLSYLFTSPPVALVTLVAFNSFSGMVTITITFLLEFFNDTDEVADLLKRLFRIFPSYCLGRGLIDMSKSQLYNDVFSEFGVIEKESIFGWNLLGGHLIAMGLSGILTLTLVFLMETNIFTICVEELKLTYIDFFSKNGKASSSFENTDADVDVRYECDRVSSGEADEDLVVLDHLTKVYGVNHMAVDRLTFGIPKGECFGLLGVNGAGKTSTFKMLTGDLPPSAGDARLDSHSITSDQTMARKKIGYCPQFDSLFDLMTPYETLYMYALLHGISPGVASRMRDWCISNLDLEKHKFKLSKSCSGGARRKLQCAIALIGNPNILLLDEPTAGVDPVSRKFLWKIIEDLTASGRALIITSHSMDECDMLCTRIAIMVDGKMRCLGSSQHLKSRFGDGFTLYIKVTDYSDADSLTEKILTTFKGSKLKDGHNGLMQFELPQIDEDGERTTLAAIFESLEEIGQHHSVEDYSVSQTSLEQVFISQVTNNDDDLY